MPDAEELLQGLYASMQDISTVQPNLRSLIYGDSGTGKTVWTMQVAQAITPPDKKIVYIDYSEGFSVFRNPEWQHLTKRVKRMQYQGLSQIETLAYAVQAGKSGFDDIGAIILDEATSMAEADLRLVRAKNVQRDPSKDPDVAEGPDYIAEQNRFGKTANILLATRVHTILVAHSRTDKRNGLDFTDAAFQPKLSTIIKRDMNLVGYFTADQQSVSGTEEPKYIRQLQVHPTRMISAKTRISGLSVKILAPALIDIVVEYINGLREDQEPPVEEVIVVEPSETLVNAEEPSAIEVE